MFENFTWTIYPKSEGLILKLLSFKAINPKDLCDSTNSILAFG
jgi:hypothetical protein